MTQELYPGKIPVMLTFDVDGESNWIARDPANLNRPVALSQGAFGPKVGLGRILDLLRRYEIPATFFVPGWIIERWKRQVTRIVEEGHEIGHHGWLHEWVDTLESREQERELLHRGIDAIRAVSGKGPRGYRSAGELSPHTLELLIEAGFSYSSNMMDDDSPYHHNVGSAAVPLVEIPFQFQLDDAPFCAFSLRLQGRQLYPPQVMFDIWTGEFDALAAEADRAFVLTMHPQYIGRAGRMAVLERVVQHLRAHDRTIFLKGEDVAKRYLQCLSGTQVAAK